MTVTVYGSTLSKGVKKDITQEQTNKVYGLGYPFGQAPKKGYFSKQAGIRLAKNNLKQFILTEKGERVMLPNFGLSLRKYLFEPLDKVTFNNIKDEILSSLSKYMPQIKVLKLGIFTSDSINAEGLAGMKIQLLVQLSELDNQTFDIEVTRE